jgi:hypothetical protein
MSIVMNFCPVAHDVPVLLYPVGIRQEETWTSGLGKTRRRTRLKGSKYHS